MLMLLLVRSQSCSFDERDGKRTSLPCACVGCFLNGKVLNSLALVSTICTAMACLPFSSHSRILLFSLFACLSITPTPTVTRPAKRASDAFLKMC